MMKPRLLIGVAAVLGLAMPSVVMAQRGGSGGFAGGGHVGAVAAGPPHAAGGRRNPLPVATPRVVYLLGVGGYYYAAPGDAAVDQAQVGVEQESQQGDDQQATADNAGDGEREGERGDNRDGGRNEGSAAARAPEQHGAGAGGGQQEQEPLPDVGTLTLVLRDGSHLDVVAFTMTQGQVVYITPEGRRLTISADIFDADATQRVNQERGTPMQLPL